MEAERFEQLLSQKEEAKERYRKEGAMAGAAWAETASYVELECARKLDPWPGDYDFIHIGSFYDNEHFGDYFREMISDDPVMEPEARDEWFNLFVSKWMEGWLESVREYIQEFHQAQREAASGPRESTPLEAS